MSARILIIEDEEPLTLLLRYNLEAEGYEVDTSARGDEGETKLKETPPDLLVLDWMLPGMAGLGLCRTFGGCGGTAVTGARPGHPLIVIYRRPLESRAIDRDDRADLVFSVVAELVAE